MKQYLARLWLLVRFSWFLWHEVKFDGLGNKIHLWDAIPWAADVDFWGIEEK